MSTVPGTKNLIDSLNDDAIDERIKLLSYSGLELLDRCDREFQLQRLNIKTDSQLTADDELTFNFGHFVGTGIANTIAGMPEDEVLWNLFQSWKIDLLFKNEKQKKSFFYGMFAVQKFFSLYHAGVLLNEYELVKVVNQHGKEIPAIELSFRIHFPYGFRYRGAIDVILRHRVTGEILVLECKTTSFSPVQPASYKNSSQGVGYSVIIDSIFPEHSSYKVLYLVYDTKQFEFVPLPFEKTRSMRAVWIQSTLNKIEQIRRNERTIYPMIGSSCLRFFKECPWFQTCTLSTSLLATGSDRDALDEESKKVYDFEFDLRQLIESQLD